MRVLVAMSGGVDSSVAGALLLEAGHEVVGATMKLWGGVSDSGCCSVADVNDARRVADGLDIEHHVFNLTDAFDAHVVAPYVASHAAGLTPNPCVECNRHLKFGAFFERALRLGFDAIATGHHARIAAGPDGMIALVRGVDRAKDQSYVLSVLTEAELSRVLLPVGDFTKAEVRALARSYGLRTADKADSQDVCFVSRHGTNAGRAAFLGDRIPLHPGVVVDAHSGEVVGTVDAVELVTVGQRRGFGADGGERRYALEVDVATRTVRVGPQAALAIDEVALTSRTWMHEPLPSGTPITVQISAHAAAIAAKTTDGGIAFASPARRVAAGQIVALYDGERVVGSGIAC